MQREMRPWGFFEVLVDCPNYKIKEIVIRPGKRLSLQLHHQRCEHWFILSGIGKVILGDNWYMKAVGDHIDIPVETKHRIENVDETNNLVFIEIQTGVYFGEDDIKRFEDDFGRIK